ncbi:MAG: TolC family protein [Planctomycetaceae bacterium]|jgi:cobalt-zinc-cadmium efflux system outer membrane protein|nr:TolC family protein [Planctomycetaceae bacterium]
MDKTKSAKPYGIDCRFSRILRIKISLILILAVFGTVSVTAQSVPASLETVQTAQFPSIPRQVSRAPGQKYIEEIWHELETATFATPTFEELGTLHEGYSLEELWEIAQTSNPSLRQKANFITAASGKHFQEGLYPNPIVTYSGDSLGVRGEIGKHGLSISQEIVTAKKKKLNRAVTSYSVEAARKEYAMECVKLWNDLRIAHNEMLHAILIHKVDEFAQNLSRDLLQVALALQKEGKSQQLDVLQFRTMLCNADLICKQAENNRLAAWRRLVSILGTPDLPYQPVRGSLIDRSPPRNWETTWAQFLQTSPQLVLVRLKTAQARMYLEREKAEQTSNIFATFSLARDIPAETTVPFVGISVPLKIYDNNRGNIIKARAEVAASQREVERMTLSLHRQLATIFSDHNNACELIHVYETSIIPDSFEVLRQTGEKYFKEESIYLELYTQRRVAVNNLVRYINALKTKSITAILMDGMLLEGSLN